MKFPITYRPYGGLWMTDANNEFFFYDDVDKMTELVRRANAFDELVRRYGDALLYIETYGGKVTASYAAAGNLEDNKRFLAKCKEGL